MGTEERVYVNIKFRGKVGGSPKPFSQTSFNFENCFKNVISDDLLDILMPLTSLLLGSIESLHDMYLS